MLATPDFAGHDNVYEPAEDSFLLLDCFEESLPQLRARFTNPVVCEIGGGSGVVTAFLRLHVFHHAVFLATDVNPAACETINATLRKNEPANGPTGPGGVADAVQTSLACGLRKQSVDVLVFNPPYVPGEAVPDIPAQRDDYTWLDLALVGGQDGMVVTWQVLNELDDILAAGGVAYVLFCARNHPEMVKHVMQERGWRVETVVLRKAGWEVLSVLLFERE